MAFYEFTGKTVKEAIAKACEELNTEETLLEVEVLEQSARGFLGLVGQRDARIRVKKRDIFQEVLEVKEPEIRSEEPKAAEPESDDSWNDVPADEAEGEVEEYKQPEVPVNQELLEAKLGESAEVLREILKRIPVEPDVNASIQNGCVYLDIQGDGSGLLIGKKGQTLDALQFLLNKIINKENSPGDKIEIIVDTENYRLRKRENLREIAVKMSAKAKKTLKPVSFNPMPPQERRIIHLILAEDKEVYTKSYGEGPMRRIIVYPRRGSSNRRRRR